MACFLYCNTYISIYIYIYIYTFDIDTACEIESLQSCMQWKPSSQRGHQTWPLTESLWVSLPLARSACAHGQRTSLPSLDLKTVALVILQSEPPPKQISIDDPSMHKWIWGCIKKIQNVQALSEWTNFQTPPNLNCHKNNVRTSFWGWDRTRFSPSNVRFLEAPHNMTLRCFSPSATWPIYGSIIKIKHITCIYIYIYIYSSIDRNIIINLCWKNIELYKLTMDQQTDKTPLLVLVVLLPVLQGTCACSGAAGNSFAPAGCVSEMRTFGKKDLNACIWSIQAWDKPFNRFRFACAEMQGQGGNLSKQHLYTPGNER